MCKCVLRKKIRGGRSELPSTVLKIYEVHTS